MRNDTGTACWSRGFSPDNGLNIITIDEVREMLFESNRKYLQTISLACEMGLIFVR